MKKEILFVLLKDFADWEGAYIAPNLNLGVEPSDRYNRLFPDRYGFNYIFAFTSGLNT